MKIIIEDNIRLVRFSAEAKEALHKMKVKQSFATELKHLRSLQNAIQFVQRETAFKFSLRKISDTQHRTWRIK